MHNVCAQPADDVKASSQEDQTSDNAESVLKVTYEVEITLGKKTELEYKRENERMTHIYADGCKVSVSFRGGVRTDYVLQTGHQKVR